MSAGRLMVMGGVSAGAVPFASGYAPGKLAELRLAAAPRVATYRGFIFASLAPSGESLVEFLGPARASFDDFVDRAPGGELEVAGGVFKHAYNGNWKLMLEDAGHLSNLDRPKEFNRALAEFLQERSLK